MPATTLTATSRPSSERSLYAETSDASPGSGTEAPSGGPLAAGELV